ncbi:hypothetical protein [Dolichospermum heterosporum]|uniref:Uncharacterized protein n=1 Tax=Dolichospermum heterosporum TAC447 TaxID=747523 RepID=A0ABY5M5V7_9CYAN|nr:hypothetical protein [Dolichospermum heterosporum]UUO17234.1 hypothetical protein NG743_09725 [Dolichospermum heterosporum TAC447]
MGGVGGVGEGCFEVEEFQIYRQAELNRTTASLLANGAILIVGEEGVVSLYWVMPLLRD